MNYEKDENIRKDFARVFNWYDYQNEYGYSSKKVLRVPEWAEIFAEVGRLEALTSQYMTIEAQKNNKMWTTNSPELPNIAHFK